MEIHHRRGRLVVGVFLRVRLPERRPRRVVPLLALVTGLGALAIPSGHGGVAVPTKPRGKLVLEAYLAGDEFLVGHIYVSTSDGSHLRRVVRPIAESPSWSPDGHRIAFTTVRGIYIATETGKNPKRIANGIQQARWSPDGKRLVYSGPLYGQLSIVDANGRHHRTLPVGQGEGGGFEPDWSPRGDEIVFVRGFYGPLNVLNIKSRRVRRLTQMSGTYSPRWSADGRTIFFVRREEEQRHRHAFYSVHRDGSDLRELGAVPHEPSSGGLYSALSPNWSPDGRTVVYCDYASNNVVSLRLVPKAGPKVIPIRDPLNCSSVDLHSFLR